MSPLFRRCASGVAAVLGMAALSLPTAPPAFASLPTALSVTQTTARDFGNGGPAAGAYVNSGPLVRQSDGTVTFYDRVAHEIRRIDPASSLVTVLAGTGVTAPYSGQCSLDTATPAAQVPLGDVQNLWADTAGSVYALYGSSPYGTCSSWGKIYRLDPNDQLWHLAVKNPVASSWICCSGPSDAYSAMAMDPSGNAYVYDRAAYVIRFIPAGSAPDATGTVVAGTAGNPGEDGDGGPATSARLGGISLLVAPGDGSFTFANGNQTKVRRVDPTGIISVVAGTGALPPSPTADVGSPATAARLSVAGLMVSSDLSQLYVLSQSGTQAALLAFTYGGTLRTVVGPSSTGSALDHCPGSNGGVVETGAADRVLVSCGYGIRSWPTDGSAATQAGTRVAGVDTADGLPSSPDGTPLTRAFLSSSGAMAVSPSGTIAVSTASGIRVLSGTTDLDTVTTLAPDLNADRLWYAADGTLFAQRTDPVAGRSIVTVSPAGVVTRLLGGGTAAVGQGATGTDVALDAWYSHATVDPATSTVYFDSKTGQIWRLDPVSGLVDLVAGNGSLWDPVEGEQAKTAALGTSPPALAWDATTGSLYFGAPGGLGRVDPDGTFHLVRCYDAFATPYSVMTCNEQFQVAPDGTLRFPGLYGIERIAADGTMVQDAPGFGPNALILPDGRLLKLGTDPAQGLLQITSVPPASTFSDAPSVAVTAGEASVHVSVTPVPGRVQRINLLATEVPANGHEPQTPTQLTSLYSDGSLPPQSLTFYRLGGSSFIAGHQYQVTVVAGESDGTAKVSASSAPITTTVVPLVDSTPPSPPTVSVTANGTSILMDVSPPSDPDLGQVVVRFAEGTVAPTSVTDGQPAGTYYAGDTSRFRGVYADPAKAYAFAAFSVDTSGNVSPAATAIRPAASLVAGDAAASVAYVSGPGTMTVAPPTPVSVVRYASGTTPPATPLDGVGIGWLSTAWGYTYTVPVATGAKVAISLFAYTDATMSAYRRTSFVLTGGASSDTPSLSATSTVVYGTRPTVTTTVTRVFATGGSQPLSGQAVDLYRRPVGSNTWTKVATATTSATGGAAFSVAVPTGSVDYQVRTTSIGPTVLLSPVRRTLVKQTITLYQSTTSVRHGYAMTLYGSVGPKRATRVYLQRYVSGRWVTLTYVSSSTTGGYKFTYKPATIGTYVLRTYVPATTALLLGVSPTRTLKAT